MAAGLPITDDSGITYQPEVDEKGQDVGLTTTRQGSPTSDSAPVVSGDVDLNQMRSNPVTVQYPSGHVVHFPTEAHANEHAASVWDQLKSGWNAVKNFQGLEGPEGEDRKTGAQASPLGQSILDHVGKWNKSVSDALEEAGAELGRKPAELLSGAKNIQAYMPSPYGQKPSMESMEATAQREHPVLSGVGEGAGRVAGGLLSPVNVGIMAAMPAAKAVPLLTRGLSIAFAADMGSGAVTNAKNVIANWAKMTPQQRASALTSGGLQTVMAGLATIHAVGGEGGVSKLKDESGQIAPTDEAIASGRRATTRATQERRVDPTQRQRVAEMSPEEMRQELLTSKATGLPNRRSFEDQEPAKATAMSDADGLKALNDKFGYAAGDALLKAKGEALKEAGLDAYHDKGDEFLYRGESSVDLKQKLEKAREILRNREIQVTMDDGTTKAFKGADFSYGTGEDLSKAESGLKQHKAEREARGERARGELRGIQETRPQEDQGDQGTPEVTPEINPEAAPRRLFPPTAPNGVSGIVNLLKGESGEAKIPFTGNMMDEEEKSGPVWFSKAENTIADKVPNNASGDAIRSVLINNGVKPDEMKWSGLDEYLEGKPKVPKADLQKFIAENKLQLKEVNYGGRDEDTQALRDQHQKLANLQDLGMQTVDRAYGRLESPVPMNTFLSGTPGERAEWLSKMSFDAAEAAQKYEQLEEQRSSVAEKMTGFKLNVNPEETARARQTVYDVIDPANGLTKMTGNRADVNNYMNEHSESMKKQVAAKYEKWVVPGEKTKYTEKLLTLPPKATPSLDEAKKAYEDFNQKMREKYPDYADRQTLATAEENAEQNRLYRETVRQKAKVNEPYVAPHFQQESNPNVVAHVRYSDRPAVDGKKTMFLEEAQSDWHSDIRHKGYQGEYAENRKRIDELKAKDKSTFKGDDIDQPLSVAEKAELTKLQDRNRDISPAHGSDESVPNAPFHQNWHELAMKRMLREAAEKGYDRLAWTTGKQQADLYSLARHIAAIEYEPDTKTLVIHEHNGKIHREDVDPDVKSLTPYLGRDLAEKLTDQIDSYDPGPSEDSLYEHYSGQYSVEPIEQEPEYKIEFPEHGQTEYFDSEREAEKFLKKWWEEKYPYHDPETGEWIAPEKGEERENDDEQDDIEPPKIDTQEREPEYGVYSDGDLIDSGYDSEREANRAMSSHIDEDVRNDMNEHEQELPGLSGLDLKQGGEFHKLLYDTMIPSFLKKYGKKWGAEVKDAEMKGMGEGKNVYEGPDLSDAEFNHRLMSPDLKEVLTMRERDRLIEVKEAMQRQNLSFTEAMNKLAASGVKGIHDLAERFGGRIVAHPSNEKVHSIDITPQLRRSVLKGQPIAKNQAIPAQEQNA